MPSPGPPFRYGPSNEPTDMPEYPSKIASQYCYNIEVVESVGGEEGDGHEDTSDSQARTTYILCFKHMIPQGIVSEGQKKVHTHTNTHILHPCVYVT